MVLSFILSIKFVHNRIKSQTLVDFEQQRKINSTHIIVKKMALMALVNGDWKRQEAEEIAA
jgi:hypothetical protein